MLTDKQRLQAGQPQRTTHAPAAGDAPPQDGNTAGDHRAAAGQQATGKTTGTPTRRSSDNDQPHPEVGGSQEYGNEPSTTPTTNPASPRIDSQRQVDASHGSVVFAYTDGKMAVANTQPQDGYTARVTKLQTRRAEVKFTSDHTVQTVQASVSDNGDWTIRVITVSS
ncbi:hypothetical protein [Fodinicola acaciae]|uniref:hypothetical protein n=1 Tax=Fodinicola acaciae TaxID=2681555 RepID=UPI0013D54B0D|nr:hypothetical protein [Fodinicola acaciae]